MDDFDSELCGSKHYGTVLSIEGDFAVMRCSFCEQIFKNLIACPSEIKQKQRSSRTCVSACDWIFDEKTVKCKSCSYIGPLPVDKLV